MFETVLRSWLQPAWVQKTPPGAAWLVSVSPPDLTSAKISFARARAAASPVCRCRWTFAGPTHSLSS
ncbi:hypothetical protein ACWKT5_02195 [Streptomyces avermitilis]